MVGNANRTPKNHTRLFPLFHFVALPIFLLNFLNSVRHVWLTPNWIPRGRWSSPSGWWRSRSRRARWRLAYRIE